MLLRQPGQSLPGRALARSQRRALCSPATHCMYTTDAVSSLLDRQWLLKLPDTQVGVRYSLNAAHETCTRRASNLHKRLSSQLDYVTLNGGDGRGFWVVRDDLLHPIAGGNKLRKLDALLPALLASGATDIVRRTCCAVSALFLPRLAWCSMHNAFPMHQSP